MQSSKSRLKNHRHSALLNKHDTGISTEHRKINSTYLIHTPVFIWYHPCFLLKKPGKVLLIFETQLIGYIVNGFGSIKYFILGLIDQ